MSDVYATVVHGFYLVWKRIHLKRKVEIERYMKEIDIMKKLSHTHMIRLIGTYTHRQFLGLLLHPIAICDLSTFFEDVEAYWSDSADGAQRSRLAQLHFCGHESSSYKASSIYLQLGCLESAVAYVHDQKIQHKDLKLSNILMAPEGLYLSDFGSATDVSLRSRSASENEQGTPKYFVPEDARYEPSGRAADISSLGCVLLEILILNTKGSLKRLRANRLTKDPAFHANISQLDAWLPLRDDVSARDYNLYKETRAMLQELPNRRPMAQDLIQRLVLYDGFDLDERYSVFGECCRASLVPKFDLKKERQTSYLLKHNLDESMRRETHLSVALAQYRQRLTEVETEAQELRLEVQAKQSMADDLRNRLSASENRHHIAEQYHLYSGKSEEGALVQSNPTQRNMSKPLVLSVVPKSPSAIPMDRSRRRTSTDTRHVEKEKSTALLHGNRHELSTTHEPRSGRAKSMAAPESPQISADHIERSSRVRRAERRTHQSDYLSANTLTNESGSDNEDNVSSAYQYHPNPDSGSQQEQSELSLLSPNLTPPNMAQRRVAVEIHSSSASKDQPFSEKQTSRKVLPRKSGYTVKNRAYVPVSPWTSIKNSFVQGFHGQ